MARAARTSAAASAWVPIVIRRYCLMAGLENQRTKMRLSRSFASHCSAGKCGGRVNRKFVWHGGAPVLRGEKWVATKWMRERRFD